MSRPITSDEIEAYRDELLASGKLCRSYTDAPVAHHPLDLVDIEDADRLCAERVGQIVEANLWQLGALGGALEMPMAEQAIHAGA
jgi:hypothetical protein